MDADASSRSMEGHRDFVTRKLAACESVNRQYMEPIDFKTDPDEIGSAAEWFVEVEHTANQMLIRTENYISRVSTTQNQTPAITKTTDTIVPPPEGNRAGFDSWIDSFVEVQDTHIPRPADSDATTASGALMRAILENEAPKIDLIRYNDDAIS